MLGTGSLAAVMLAVLVAQAGFAASAQAATAPLTDIQAAQLEPQKDTWAVLACSSRYWFNYRHVANVLSVYYTVKRLGIPDSHIILMLADDMACNPCNPFPTQVFNHPDRRLDLYTDDIEVDYRGLDVNVESFFNLLTGQHDAAVPPSKRLLATNSSNVLLYLTGHGGDEFLKFQDTEELLAAQLAAAIDSMWHAGRYRELLFIIDTCQAATMYQGFTAPNVLAMSSSILGESSYSHHIDPEVGLAVIDRFTFFMFEFFEKSMWKCKSTLRQMADYIRHQPLLSTFHARTDLFGRPLAKVRVEEFFGMPSPLHEQAETGPEASNSGQDHCEWQQDADEPDSPRVLNGHVKGACDLQTPMRAVEGQADVAFSACALILITGVLVTAFVFRTKR